MRNGSVSFWMDQIGATAPTRPGVDADVDADVCIVGAGLTGLWTAYWLRQHLPTADIVVIDSRWVGYGASGRNGGWLSGKMVGLRRRLASEPTGRSGVLSLQRACIDAIDEVLGIVDDHQLDVDAARGGYLQIARTPAELERLRQAVADDHAWGLTHSDVTLLDAAEIRHWIRIPGIRGALYSPHAAMLNPAKLVTGVARIVEHAGVRIYEDVPALALAGGEVTTPRGKVRAPTILCATEGYTPRLPGRRRCLLPMNSSMLVTEPLSQSAWSSIGWDDRAGLSGAQHTYFYAQRTADGRIALGGRGLPYRYGSRVDADGRLDRFTVRQLQSTLTGLFPDAGLRLAHAWCGVLGVPRDWCPSVRYDPNTGIGQAGGYVGQGVTASYVAAQTLADLVLGRDSRYTRLPWTNRTSRGWEAEPARWLGAYTMYGLYRAADLLEARTGTTRTSPLARLANQITGRH